MALELHLTDAQDAALTELAHIQGVSRNEAAVRAIENALDRSHRETEVRGFARSAVERYGPLLDRLAR